MDANDPTIINLRAQLRIVMGVLPIIIATLPAGHYQGVIDALEALTEPDGPPSLTREIDELRQILSAQSRSAREAIQRAQHP